MVQKYYHTTSIAKKFKKQPRDWLKTAETNDYIKALSLKINLNKDELVIVRQGGKPQEQGTWIHKKLIIVFARWLSPDFTVWCDIQIEEILQNGNKIIPKRTDLISVSDSELDRELKTLDFMLNRIQFSEKEKIEFINQTLEKINFQTLKNPHLKKREQVFTLTDLLKEFQIQIRTSDFNKKLQSFGIIERLGSGWILVDMKFGENRDFQDGKNHRYYRSGTDLKM